MLGKGGVGKKRERIPFQEGAYCTHLCMYNVFGLLLFYLLVMRAKVSQRQFDRTDTCFFDCLPSACKDT